jgi:alpha-L-arabinofuranosidase
MRVDRRFRVLVVLCFSLGCSIVLCAGEPVRITVDVAAPGQRMAPTMHGLFFEDINYAADGGLYAELVENRSFEHRDPKHAWVEAARGKASGSMAVAREAPLNAANTHFLRLEVSDPGEGGYGVANGGFDGIALREGDRYRLSLHARVGPGGSGSLKVLLEDGAGGRVVEEAIQGITASWSKYEATLTSPKTVTDARLLVLSTRPGRMDLDMVSLLPEKTFKGRRNGLRADIAQALADMKPGFLRFPGGCIVEGRDLGNAYRWKDTVGDVAERKQNANLWQNNRSPQYHQTYGLGFFEFFQLSEDIGAEPLPVINCGMSCQARRGSHVPLAEIGPWVKDALDLIEFANGPVTSEWGARRAAMGHPEPFHLKYLAVGNEQWREAYFDRYVVFQREIKSKYPDIQIISSSGPAPNDGSYEFAWRKFRGGTPADIVDEHYYVPPPWLLENGDRYDSYDPGGPKVFVGEFAAHDGGRRNNLRSALAEAAYMTSLWRNSDVVVMASYAPLLAKVGRDQWRPNLIWFDNTRVVLTPSYHAQVQFAKNRPDVVLPTEVQSPAVHPRPSGMIGVGTWNTQAEYKDIRVVDAGGKVLFESDFSKGMEGWKTAGGDWSVEDGALRQGGNGTNIRALAGDPSWTDYTLTLKARKIRGEEGFLILFHTADIENPVWWNIGGWRNVEHSLQGEGVTERHVRGAVEANRWYDIRLELRDAGIKAYLDGQLIHEDERKPVPAVYAAAGRDARAGEVVLQMVNPQSQAHRAAIQLRGLGNDSRKARVTTLAGAGPGAENTLENPGAVTPRQSDFDGIAPEFEYTLEPYSLTTLRVRTN